MSTLAEGKSTADKVKIIVSLALPLAILIAPGDMKVKMFLAISLWGILTIAFSTMHVIVPSLLMPALFVLTGLAPIQAVYSPWASTVVSLTIGSLIMANCLQECGLMRRLAYWLLRSCGGKFTRVCWGFFWVSLALSIITFGNIAFVIAALLYSLINVLGISKTREGNVLMIGSMYACLTTLWFCYNPTSVPIVAAAASPVLGKVIEVTWLDFAHANWPVIVFAVITEWLFLKVNKIGKSSINLDPDYFQNKLVEMGKVTKREKWGAFLLILMVLYILLSPLHKQDTGYGFILFAALAMLPGIEVATPDTLKKVDWSIAFFLTACLSIGVVATMLNVNQYFVTFAGGVVDNFGSGITMAFIMLIGTLANLLLTPLTILTALGAPMTQLAVTYGFDPLASFFTLIYTEWLVLLPYETMPTMVWFAFGCMTMKEFFKLSFVRVVAFFIFYVVAIMPWWDMIGFF